MAGSSSVEKPWADRWRAACTADDVECLFTLLQDTSSGDKRGAQPLRSSEVRDAVLVAYRTRVVGLLGKVLSVVGSQGVGVGLYYRAILHEMCDVGCVDMVREMLGLSDIELGDVREAHEAGLQTACAKGHVDVVRELLALTGYREVDVHAGPNGLREAGFQLACENGHGEVVRELLALSGAREVDVHAGPEGEPEFGFQLACANGQIDVLRELLGLTGHRAIPLQTRLDAGQVAVQPAKDAVWGGTSTRCGRRGMVLLRAGEVG